MTPDETKKACDFWKEQLRNLNVPAIRIPVILESFLLYMTEPTKPGTTRKRKI